MGDYIFLIIAIAISIFAAINKSQKAKLASQQPLKPEAKPRNYFMDQLLGEDFLEEEQEKKVPVMPAKPLPEKVAFKSSSDTQKGLNYHLPRFKSTLPDRPKHTTITVAKRQNREVAAIEEPEETPSYLEDFSLRKAIIYSQILEQKF
ncbi:MAG TPA: hypothetical protein DCL77_19435 [Prolixibacteraceae bacterium]|jgi:hypothetical protein|nr:hypothetical protein [Prolixibacteraceae bacterium]